MDRLKERLLASVIVALMSFNCHRATDRASTAGETDRPASVSDTTGTTARQTKLEAFASKYGVVVIRGFEDVGNVLTDNGGYLHITVGEYSVVNTGEKQRGLAVKVKSVSPEREDDTTIDYDEIEPLIRGIDYITASQRTVTKLAKFEALYITKSGFVVAKFGDQGQTLARVAAGRSSSAQLFMEPAKLGEVKELLQKAKRRLDEAATTAARPK